MLIPILILVIMIMIMIQKIIVTLVIMVLPPRGLIEQNILGSRKRGKRGERRRNFMRLLLMITRYFFNTLYTVFLIFLFFLGPKMSVRQPDSGWLLSDRDN